MQEIKPVYVATIARLWNNGYCALRPKAFLYFFACHHLHTPIYYIYLVEGGVSDVVVHVHRLRIAAHLGLSLLHGSLHLGL